MKKILSWGAVCSVFMLILVCTGCDETVLTPDGGDLPIADPVIPAEFGRIETIGYTGDDPETIDDVIESVINGFEIAGSSFVQLVSSSADPDEEIQEFINFQSYIQNYPYNPHVDYVPLYPDCGYQMDPMNFTGSVTYAFNEIETNPSLTGSYRTVLDHQGLIDVLPVPQLDGSVALMPVFRLVRNDSGQITGLFDDGSFFLSMETENLDFTLSGTEGTNNVTVELIQVSGDAFVSLKGDQISTYKPVDNEGDEQYEEVVFKSGLIDFNADISLKMALVLSSMNPDVNGLKAVATMELEDDIEDFPLEGIDMIDGNSIINSVTDALLELSYPTVKFDLFSSDNSYLFSEDVAMADELELMLFFLLSSSYGDQIRDIINWADTE